MARCERSAAVYLAAVDGTLSDEQRAHAATCADCSAALRAAARFEGELEAVATELAGPALPPDLLAAPEGGRGPALRLGVMLGTVVATLGVVAVAFVLAWQSGFVSIGGPGPTRPPAGGAAHTIHVLISNHRALVLTVEAETTVAGVPTTSTAVVGACRGAYFTIPLGDAWRVTAGGVLLGVGPPSPVADTTAGDLTLRVSYGVSSAQLLDGAPQDNGLDPAVIVATDLAPCR